MSKTLRKIMCAVLSAALCFSNLNITAIFADTILGSAITSEDSMLSDGSEDLILDDGSETVNSDGMEEKQADQAFDNQTENAPAGEEENAVYEPVNRIRETKQVGVKLTDWWYKNPQGEKQTIETTSASEQDKTTVVCDLSQIEEEDLSEAGFDLSFAFLKEAQERTVQASDYLSFMLPACLKDLTVTGADEDYYTYSLEEQEDHSCKMTVTFQAIPETPNLSGTIHMAFSLQETMENEAGNTCLIVLQENQENPEANISYEVIFPGKSMEETAGEEPAAKIQLMLPDAAAAQVGDTVDGSGDEPAGDSGAGSDTDSLVKGEFNVSGKITFDEKLDGTDWRDLVRPTEFDQPIEIVQTYRDENGQEHTLTYTAQDDLSQNAFYLKFVHDGEGGGDFTIEHVPKTVTVDGTEYQVTGYEVKVAPSLPYYQNTDVIEIDDPKNPQAVISTLNLSLKSQKITLQPTVVPSDGSDNPSFQMNATFTNTAAGNISATGGKTFPYYPSKEAATVIQVPLGISYSVTQVPTSGYKFHGQYETTITQAEGGGESTSTTGDTAVGTIREGENITITTVNYAQNVFVGFDVNWIDNNRTTRPTLTGDKFVLQYKTEGGKWIDLTQDRLAELGIDKMPVFDTTQSLKNQYSFTGLPAVDRQNQPLTYQVLVAQNPNGYTSTQSDKDGRRTFTFQETTAFAADIIWNDNNNTKNLRPTEKKALADKLKLYRRTGNGSYEEVYNALPESFITENGNSWSVSINGLPRYDNSNTEYDYVLVQGTIGEDNEVTQTNITNYKAYYNNGSGSYGNDVKLCHNHGKITEVLYDEVDFQADKTWKDPAGEADSRPDVKMTLWRYVKDEAVDLDDAYESGKAAQVVFQTVGTDNRIQENIVSCSIDKSKDNALIEFNATTVTGLSENYKFPRYDDHGREYVYFVRETLTGSNADNYEIQYRDKGGTTHSNGTLSGGTVTNVRREKAAVAINKVWQNPSGLASIAGTKVQLKIEAPLKGVQEEETGAYKELTVYSGKINSYDELTGDKKDEAQTATGFTSSIASAEVIYYVNIYDENGQPFDMSKARIKEIITKDGTTVECDANGTFTMGKDTYKVSTKYEKQDSLGDGTKEFQYTQKNTITGTREYTIKKNWDPSITSEAYADIQYINFTLQRRTTKDQENGKPADYETVGTYQVARDDTATTWQTVLNGLDKYDSEGYEYEYIATEVSFVTDKGETISTGKRVWSVNHYRTPDQTTAINYISQSGGDSFQVTKNWMDNGDTVNRKDLTVRVYYREKLLEELQKQQDSQKKSDNEYADLSSLNDCVTYKIDKSNLSTINIPYSALYEKTGSKDQQDKDNWSSYIVLEYLVGSESDGAQPARYTYGELKAAASKTWNTTDSEGNISRSDNTYYSFAGTVENKDRLYETEISVNKENTSGHVYITNTRIGTTKITVTKTWKDDSNAAGKRPDFVTFRLYRDGSPYTGISDEVTIEATGAVATLDHETGVVTVTKDNTSTANTWSFTLNNLPMFSSHAVPYSYDVEENVLSATDSSVSYIQEKGDTTVTGNGKSQQYTFDFSNTITETVSHVAYKYWKDPASFVSNRPDLYLKLYQYKKSEQKAKPETEIEDLPSYHLYTDYKDQIWTAGSGTTPSQDYETGYNWKIVIDDLPGFDEDGSEYGYVFVESMNNDGKTVLGQYTGTSQTRKVTEGDPNSDTYEVLTNVIQDYMTVKGLKTWTGLAGYQTSEDDLPNPKIQLYRTTDPSITNVQNYTDDDGNVQTYTDEQIAALIKGGKITLVDTTSLSDHKTTYAFPDNSVTEDEIKKGLIVKVKVGDEEVPMLPKFDPEGQRYTYLVREKIPDQITGQLYTETNVNGTLSNVFRKDVNRRTITVTKTWEGRENLQEGEKKYPSVTFNLYRYEAGKESSTTVLIETKKINANEFANGTASYTFKDLLIYSPTGVQYCYYITENAIKGYTISYTDEPGIVDKKLVDEKLLTGSGSKPITITETMLGDYKQNSRIDVISCPKKWNDVNATPEDLDVKVGTCNTYDQKGSIQIAGEKEWDDNNDEEGLRPTSITVNLKRHTIDETGQSNKVTQMEVTLEVQDAPKEQCKTPYIVWTDKGTSTWKYTIYNLERYAPNGMPYIYTLSEDPVPGYKQAPSVEAPANENGDITQMGTMTNRFEGTYYVRKNWWDGYNKYNLRPQDITVELQRFRDNGSTWETYQTVTLTSDNVITNTRNSSWQYTFTNLPKYFKSGTDELGKIVLGTYQYRCVETAIGGVPVETKKGKLVAGAYECKDTTLAADKNVKTVIENTLDSTSLVVTKEWEGDHDNLYDSRPEQLTFMLQKRGIKVINENDTAEDVTVTPTPDEGATETPVPSETETPTPSVEATVTPSLEESQLGDWETVTKADGSPYTFTISAADNWTKTLEDLPVATVVVEKGEDGKITSYTLYSLYFRAVEVHTDASETPLGAKNYEDITDYSTNSSAHVYNKGKLQNESTITNKLIRDDPAKSISVKKVWRRVESETPVTAEFELLYKITSETEWHCYGGEIVPDDCDWTSHTSANGCKLQSISTTEASKTVTWNDLPKYDRDGNKLDYKVVEHPIPGYKTVIETEVKTEEGASPSNTTQYTFTNIELQSYTVKKIWQNTDYAEKTKDGYTATFQLQQKIADGGWTDVQGQEITLTSISANDETQEYTWQNLPKYTTDGKEITYRAQETKINEKTVTNNTNGAYMVSYQYDDTTKDPAFGDSTTTATNRMIYGFVNLSKKAAYLAPGVTENGGSLKGVKFNIYQGNGLISEDTKPYVSDVETDENGNLINKNGQYGNEQKYLISGTYTLKEASTNPDYSVWKEGVTFIVGSGKAGLTGTLADTGEHGTAWIRTTVIGSVTLRLEVEYKNENTSKNHRIGDTCPVYSNAEAAVNLESRGVLSFTKTGPLSGSTYEPLDTHGEAAGESTAYFGVYLDEDCKNQVAGMVSKDPADKTTMILTDKAQDGKTTLGEEKDDSGVPYLRAYTNSSYLEYPFTLLTGTYYIKELVAPAGYKLDTTIRKAVVAKIDSTAIGEDLSGVYPGNKAKIMLVSAENGTDAYPWSNTPNVVTLYKRDQYGRPVTLKDGGYLELKIEGEGNTFPSGENVIRLCQNQERPATKTDGTGITGYVSYNATEGAWTITGLFDIGKTYTLSEPLSSVPDENIVAKLISFTMDEDGKIAVTSSDAEAKDNPLAVVGDDYKNYYKPDAENNVVVMRDVSRYLKDVALEKKDSVTNAVIPNISFELYKYDGKVETTGKLKNVKPVLENNVYLTTNNQGKIVLSEQDASIKNQITGCALKYGLDVGKYYFKEVERGASDKYRLVDDIFFEIKPTTESGTATDYSDYAEVKFTTNSHVSQTPENGKTGTVTNDPVTKSPKTLKLTKVDSANSNQKLAGARFTLTYKSVTHGDAGSVTSGDDLVTWNCITDNNGELYLADADWKPNTKKPDISKKGTYILKEIKAPDNYMTHTKDGTETLVTLVEFTMNSSNQIENVKKYNETDTLADVTFSSTAESGEESSTTRTYKDTDYRADALVNVSLITKNDGEHDSLSVELKNEKTVVSIAKRNDIESGTKTRNQKSLNGEELSGATLSIYEGIQPDPVAEVLPVIYATVDNVWNLPQGTLKEDTIYTLVETTSPVGYMKADPIYFKLHGTTVKDGKCISQLYVWTGTGNPTVDAEVGWEKTTNIKDKVLTMVDEAIIAPVDMRKVVTVGGTKSVLPGAKFLVADGSVELSGIDVDEALKADSTYPGNVLGIAVTDAKGYLVWEKIFDAGYHSKHIFTAEGKRAETDTDGALKNTIILQQNANGYTFTEIYAPDQAYNKHESFTVKITDQNYRDYKTTAGYDTNKYIDIKAASGNPDKTVSSLSDRTTSADFADAYENPGFKTTFQLYKYDAEHPAIIATHNNYGEIGMAGVTFTLSKEQSDGSYTTVHDYTTAANGLLSFDILEKGTYKLVEKETLTGYILNAEEMIFTIVNDDYHKTLTYSKEESNSNHTIVVKDAEGNDVTDVATYDLPNYREHGTVTLTKQDANSGVKLNGVKYTLTRVSPTPNPVVDKYFPSTETGGTNSLIVETGKKYKKIASAANQTEFEANIEDISQSAGQLILEDLQWGTYKLVELEEKDGYIKETKELTFVIGNDKLNETVKDNEQEYVTNTKNQLTIKKTDIAGNALTGQTLGSGDFTGAQFKLYPVTQTDGVQTMTNTAAKFYLDPNTVGNPANDTIEISAADGTSVYGLTKGTYVLRETKAPDGYELAKDVIFTMSANGTISDVTTCTVGEGNQITEDEDGSAVVKVETADAGFSNAKSTLTVKDTPIRASLTKVLKDGETNVEINSRGNATFVIKGIFADSNGQEVEKTFTSNNITTELDAKLIGGNSYTIKETAAPAGFEAQKEEAVINVGKDGKITVTPGASFLTVNDADGTAAMTFTDQPIELKLKKVDESSQEIAESTLGYAVFEVTGEFVKADGSGTENTTISNLTTQNFTATLSKRIISGETYTVTETFAPNGFRLTASFTFTVDSYGNIQSLTGSDAAGNDTDTLTITNHPNTITFVKIDEGGNLAGAKFTLTAEDSRVTQAFVNITENNKPVEATVWKNTEIKWTSTNTGTTITNHLIAGMRYKLSEERVLNHEVMTNDIIFHVKKDGTVVIDTNSSIPNNSGDAASISGTVMTIRNPLIKGTVVLTKYFTSQKKESYTEGTDYQVSDVLAGAVYKLYCKLDKDGVDHSSNPIQVKTDENNVYNPSGTKMQFTTGSDGKITITNLPEGKYYFVEVDAPKAYYIDNTRIPFEIHNAAQAAAAVHAVDPRINARISLKKFSGGTGLKDAVFDVAYSETKNGTYTSIGTMTTGNDGIANLIQGIYPGNTEPETLRRGFYRLTELSADGQMLNTTDGTRNTISFEIGNTPDKEYEVKYGTDVQYTPGGIYISLNNQGVVDTPIPTKDIKVTKQWLDDNGMTTTFRPESIQVRLYRIYNGGSEEAVGDIVTLNDANSWSYTWSSLPSYVNIETDTSTHTKTTYLYTYTVKEVDSKTWYTVSYEHSTATGNTAETNVQDGNTTATINNGLNGGEDAKKLTITKALGGGSSSDEFKVRVKLTKNGVSVGNSGYYQDSCTVTVTGESTTTVTPDSDGWMTIHGGETITVVLPKDVTYEVEEQTDNSGNAVVVSGNNYVYTPRYDENKTGTITSDTATIIRNAVHKSIKLAKVNESNEALTGAEFTVTYTPGTNTINPEAVGTAWTETGCKVNNDGKLADSKGAVLDITQQGTYTIMETKAPVGYITPTDNGGKPITLAVITVDNQDIMTVAKGTDNASALVKLNGRDGLSKEGSVADITVTNEKTKARIGKTIDYAKNNSTDTAEGSYLAGAKMQILEETAVQVEWTTDASNNPFITSNGLLKEEIVYTLHEESAPNGYKKAADQHFKLSGTYTTADGTRYSRIVMTDSSGVILQNQNTDGTSYGDPGVVDGILNMADETIIAPVDLQKVLANYDSTSWTAVKRVEFTVTDGNSVRLGTAITNDKGYLVWKSITTDGYSSRLIYDADGHIVTSDGTGTGIILRQNDSGYVFTESYAPDHVYNDDRSYHVSITEANYDEYRTEAKTGTLYKKDMYINLVESENAKANNYKVTNLSTRGNQTNYTSADNTTKLAVNLPYKSTVTLHKYDADEEANKANIPGTEFTLYRVSGEEKNVYTKAYSNGELNNTGVFITNDAGNISIEIHEKGTYILQETKAATGYQLDTLNNTFTFTLVDTASGDENAAGKYGYNQTNALKRETAGVKDPDGVPNDRLKGQVTLTKKDDKTGELLDGVVYTLKRKDTPNDANDNELTDYLLKQSVDVTIGKNYTAVKSESRWTLTESDGESGKITITGLNWGSYTLTEKTELPGYKMELDAGGQAVNTYSFTVDGKSNALEFTDTDTNTKNSVTFYKTNQIDAEAGVVEGDIKPLAGAVFEVHEGDGTGCSGDCVKASFYASDTANKDQTVTSVTTGADGKVTIYGLATDTTENTPKTYHLVETVAPKGYKLQTKPTVFTIDRQGNVQVKNAEGTYADANQVTMQDEPIKLYIQKLGEEDSTKLSGAEFELTDICTDACDHKLAANDAVSETITVTSDDGKVMIPIERVIGGHTYKLKETKAPDGYECTAEVSFTVKTDGTIENLNSDGGYKGTSGTEACASLDANKTTINIKNEKIRISLTKVDYEDSTTLLAGVTFTLKPMEGSSFASEYNNTGLIYDASTDTYTFTTDNSGKISFPEGLLKHDNFYLLKEKATINGYYLGKEARDGVILKIGKDGGITIQRLADYEGKTIGTDSSCPVTVSATGNSELISKNMKSTSFDLTKLVEGNMGDLGGTFQIKMEVYEPDGTIVGERTVRLKLNEKYDSVTGFNGADYFGEDAIPVGATLVITEDNELDYAAVLRIIDTSGKATEIPTGNKGTVKLTLDTATKVSLELVNTKNVAIDVGVNTENQSPWASLALLLPAVWLAYRYRRKRRGGEY